MEYLTHAQRAANNGKLSIARVTQVDSDKRIRLEIDAALLAHNLINAEVDLAIWASVEHKGRMNEADLASLIETCINQQKPT